MQEGATMATWAGFLDDSNTPARFTSAAVCERGHPLTADLELHPAARFCSQCGATVMAACQGCGAEIQGHYVPPGVAGVSGPYTPPSFCFSCGQPFPWTAEKLVAAKDLADELEDVTADDRAKLKTAIDDVAAGGPRAEAAAARIKRILGRAGSAVGQAFWKITVEVAGEAARKILVGP
jgi:hypothetical protein